MTTQPEFRPLRLGSPRLVLRHFQASDAPALYRYRNDPEVARYQGWNPPSEAEARAFVLQQSRQPPAVPNVWLQLALELKTGEHMGGDTARGATVGGETVGDVAFKTDGAGQAEFGYSLARAFQGRGYMTEAVGRLLAYLFTDLGLHRVTAHADVRNGASHRLLGRVGLRREGHFVENHFLRGEWTSEYAYALLAREWRARGEGGSS